VRRLSLATLERAKTVRRPLYDPRRLGTGILHLGVGAFHRAHQAVFTEDALEAAGGAWGIVGVSLRRPDAALALGPQDGLYTLETRSSPEAYRIIGALRQVIAASLDPDAALNAFASPAISIATVTVTEAAYALAPDGALDLTHPDIAHDLEFPEAPISAPGWIVAGLARRRARHGGPISILSCDNLRGNGAALRRGVMTLAGRLDPGLAAWIASVTAFPSSMVDAITPASDSALFARVAQAIGLEDGAAVQREPYARWAIEDDFAGPRPLWERAGVEIVSSVEGLDTLKIHGLNAAHSALAYLGPPRGHALVREAIKDPELARFLDAMMAEEVAPVFPELDIAGYWRGTRARLSESAVDHHLDQIARDGGAKLRERIHPLIIANARAGRPSHRLGAVVRAWASAEALPLVAALDDPTTFSDPFRTEPAVRAAVLREAP